MAPISVEEIAQLYKEQKAYNSYIKSTSVDERIKWLKKLKEVIISQEEDIKSAIYLDFKKNAIETETTEILASILELDLFIKNLKRWSKTKNVKSSWLFASTKAQLHYEPKGNTLIITPWNYPFQLPMVHLVASVAAGNTVILKLSEFTPHINQVIEDIINQVFERKHVAVIQGGVEETTYLLSLKFDHIHFTGSPAVGKIIMEAASKHLSSITLELGGKSPAFIDKTANLQETSRNIIWAKFTNMGQTCIAPDYLLVDSVIADSFEQVLREEMVKAFGPKAQESPDLARIINIRQYERLIKNIEDLDHSSAKWIITGENDKEDLFIHPRVLKNMPLDSILMQEEIFGPILPIIYYQHVDEALDLVAQKEKPLALYIFSKDNTYKKKVLNRTSAGGTTINDAMIHIMHPNLPFGGVNNSGIGQSLGIFGFKAFSHERAVLEARLFPMSKFFWYPYSSRTKKILQFFRKIFG